MWTNRNFRAIAIKVGIHALAFLAIGLAYHFYGRDNPEPLPALDQHRAALDSLQARLNAIKIPDLPNYDSIYKPRIDSLYFMHPEQSISHFSTWTDGYTRP